MRVSFHRRRQQTLIPTRRRRSPLVMLFLFALMSTTVAFAAKTMRERNQIASLPGAATPPPAAMVAIEADADDALEERIHAHLSRLQR